MRSILNEGQPYLSAIVIRKVVYRMQIILKSVDSKRIWQMAVDNVLFSNNADHIWNLRHRIELAERRHRTLNASDGGYSSAKPLVRYWQLTGRHCDSCRRHTMTKMCACEVARYCSRKCQKDHWKRHRLQCQQRRPKFNQVR